MKITDPKTHERLISLLHSLLYTPSVLYAACLFKQTMQEDYTKPTMSVTKTHFLYNPKWVSERTDQELAFLIRHEACHLLFNHHTRMARVVAAYKVHWNNNNGVGSALPPTDSLWKLGNMAADLEINSMLDQYNKPLSTFNHQTRRANPATAYSIPTGALLPGIKPFETYPHLDSLEAYFTLLLLDSQHINPDPQNGGSSSESGSQDVSFDPDMIEQALKKLENGDPTPTEAEKEATLRQDKLYTYASDLVNQLHRDNEEAKKQIGRLPGGEKLRFEVPRTKGVLQWQRFMRTWVSKFVQQENSTYRKPNRRAATRVDVVIPSKLKPVPKKIVFIVDTSGSMEEATLNRFARELFSFVANFQNTQLTLIQCDTCIQHEATYTYGTLRQALSKDPAWYGRGGTYLKPAFDRAIALRADAIVCYTDGQFGAFKHDKNKVPPCLWVLTDQYEDKPSAPCDWGEMLKY